MSLALFVTGTDTGIGKTLVATALLRAARRQGIDAAGFKPVAAGCDETEHGPRNDDALALLAESMPELDYASVNPVALPAAIAPHIAAEEIGTPIDRGAINDAFAAVRSRAELVIVEGAGGWQVPLGDDWTFADWARDHRLPVLMVVGLRLGCLNHALLTAADIGADALRAWVANELPPVMPRVEANRCALEQRLDADCAARLGAGVSLDVAADALAPWLGRFVAGRQRG